ncbi:putative scaffolding protein [Serratia phage vB_SmaP-Kaonashi]|nr:putative scaffolding protein [Serratia phage vB_SmaP-Kaonashi]
MLFMNIGRKFGAVFMNVETGGEGAPGGGAAPAEAAPAAEAAAAVPAAEPAKEAAAAVPETHAMDEYISQYEIDNPALSVALGFLKDNGISPTDPAFQLAENEGDFTLLKALLAKNGAAGADAMIGILEGAVNDFFAQVEAHDKATAEIVGSIMGDKQEAVLAWAKENADEGEKAAINEMFEAGGVYARAASMMLMQAYSGADVTQPAANPVSLSTPAHAGAPLSAREYAEAVDALYRKHGNTDPRGTPEYAELTARRNAARRAGY